MTKPDPAEALAQHIADQPFSVVQRALRVLDWPLRFEIREDAEPSGPAATEATEPASPAEAMTTAAVPTTPGLADGITEPASSPLRDQIANAIGRIPFVLPIEHRRKAADEVLSVILPTTRITATLARMSEADVQRVIDVTESQPPANGGDSEWDSGWFTAMEAVRKALTPPVDQPKEQ